MLLHYLLPLVSGNEPLTVDASKIVGTLLVTQLVPLCVGVAVRQWRPLLADRLQKPSNLVSKVLNLVAVGLILVTQFHLLTEIRPRGLVGMLALLIGSWAAGWLLGGPGTDARKAMTLTTSLRNVGLVIASSAFAGTPAVTAALAYGLFAVVGSLFLALAWRRHGAARSLNAEQTNAPSAEPAPK
jgi:BASS family bile acid:Na+ symporter